MFAEMFRYAQHDKEMHRDFVVRVLNEEVEAFDRGVETFDLVGQGVRPGGVRRSTWWVEAFNRGVEAFDRGVEAFDWGVEAFDLVGRVAQPGG
jgi:hypothetical protein